jgi:methionyl-tRNA synthetase
MPDRSEPERPRYYVTTPIYYVNDKPHIGHAYTTLACDVLARFKRLDGHDVHFLTGTDEHGQKVQQAAEAAGIDPLAFCDGVSQNFRDLARTLGCSNDDFIRTTEPRHREAVQALWRKLRETGDIYLGEYEGWYSVRDEAFWLESELTDGPNGTKLAPTGAPVTLTREPSYFFRLSAWGDKLLEHYERNPGFIGPTSRRNEVVSFVKGGLKDLSVSRTSVTWGVPVPDDPSHTIYVWLDALTNYMSAVGYPDTAAPMYRRFWPADLHMVGKDIIRFHAVYWPAFLLAAGLEPPRRVFAHGWWTNEGQKISKSLGNVIDPVELVATYGLDQVRYFLMREVPFGQDGDFSRKALIQRINGDLANDLGNLAQRSLSMIAKNLDGVVPEPGEFNAEDREVLSRVDALLAEQRGAYDLQEFHVAIAGLWNAIGAANSYFAAQAPWALKKTDPARMGTVLYVTAEAIRQAAILVQPLMPNSAAKLLDQLGIAADARGFDRLGAAGRLAPGAKLPAPQGVFPRWVDEAPAA